LRMNPTPHRGFTIVEALITVALSTTILALLFGTFEFTVNQFIQGDDTLTAGRHSQLLLSYLKADISMADADPKNRDISRSDDTGTTTPKSFVHLAQDPDTSKLTLFAQTIQTGSTGLSSQDPISTKSQTHPSTRLALARAARIQNAFAWVDPGEKSSSTIPRFFVVNVRKDTGRFRVVYTYWPASRTVQRDGPDGSIRMGQGFVTDFACSPYLEFLVAKSRPDEPLTLLKCWVEVRLQLQAVQKHDRIAKKIVDLNTRIVPRFLNAEVRGATGL